MSPPTTARLFADNCLVYRDIRGPEDLVALQNDLNALQDWSVRWGIRFNAKTCNIIQVSRSQPVKYFYHICNEVLSEVESAKYLGVTFNANLRWDSHISNVTSKANRTLHFISRTLRHCPKNTRQLTYFALFSLNIIVI